MVDLVVSIVLESVLGILNSVALQEIGLLWGLKDDLDRLETTFRTIQYVLHDAEIKQRKSEAIQNWLRKLKDAAYDAENILETIATEGLRRRLNSARGTRYQLKYFLSLKNPLLFRLKMVYDVRSISEKLYAIAEDRHKFHPEEGPMENRFGVKLGDRVTTSLVNESDICGRHEEKEEIMKNILAPTCDQVNLSVYGINGMGGLGKTTLAQMIYNDQRSKAYFELRIWVCVSDDFRIERIVRAILESIEGGGCDISELDPLQRRLQERLKGRKFLLVLDDVWNEDHFVWDKLKEVLGCGSNGNVVIITTRIEKVAFLMNAIAIHHISFLSEDDSWFLFKQRAFTNGEGEENFVSIGKDIVKKCGGVPLAINALGRMMRLKSHEKEWLAIKESEIWHLPDDENAILPALRLSYDNLVPQIRQCFVYCCIFPKDYLMDESQLIQLWMANGYITGDAHPNMYLTGQLIIKELVWRSFLHEAEQDSKGNMRYKMHDLMHDLASSVMKNESCILERKKVPTSPKTLHHLSFDSGLFWNPSDNKSVLELQIGDSLRSVIVHKGSLVPPWGKGLSSLISKQKYLRALDVSPYIHYNISLLDFICKLQRLKYLAISCCEIMRLPESLTHLYNLQTLKLTDSGKLLELPKDMKVMKNLWFLEIENCSSLACTPPGLGNLTSLRKLNIYIVGRDMTHQVCQLRDLDLGGELSIKGLDNVRNLEDARSANLMAKLNLTCLNLSWESGVKEKSAQHFEEVLEGLQPYKNLQKFFIKSYHGSKFPDWTMSTSIFHTLKEMSLEDCPRCEQLPPLGKLPSLIRLRLSRMDLVRQLDSEFYGDGETSFRALTSLQISEMRSLEEWTTTDTVGSFPQLRDLRIPMCPKLTGFPGLPNLEGLCISDSSAALVRCITFLTSLTSIELSSIAEFNIPPEGLLQNHNLLRRLKIESLPIRTLSNMLDNLSSLNTLTLRSCSNLEFIPNGLGNIASLVTLEVYMCDSLTSFPATLLEGLSSLRRLSFGYCKKLKPLSGPLKQAPPLQDLHISALPELECLPECVRRISSLERLVIANSQELRSLPDWLGNLETLSSIQIEDCENLQSLPNGAKNVRLLKRVKIEEIPGVRKAMRKNRGFDRLRGHMVLISVDALKSDA